MTKKISTKATRATPKAKAARDPKPAKNTKKKPTVTTTVKKMTTHKRTAGKRRKASRPNTGAPRNTMQNIEHSKIDLSLMAALNALSEANARQITLAEAGQALSGAYKRWVDVLTASGVVEAPAVPAAPAAPATATPPVAEAAPVMKSVTRPGSDTASGRVFDMADKIAAEIKGVPTTAQVKERLPDMAAVVVAATMSKWRNFWGLPPLRIRTPKP